VYYFPQFSLKYMRIRLKHCAHCSLVIQIVYRKLAVERTACIQTALTSCYKLINKCKVQSTIYVEMPQDPLVFKDHSLIKGNVNYHTWTTLKTTGFCYVAPCSLVEVHRRFRCEYYLHHQDDDTRLHGAISQGLSS
jgi:hypothetical protein